MKYIQDLKEGSSVNDIYLCRKKLSLVTKNGKAYESLTLQDKTGSVDVDPALDACLGLYDYYFTAYVSLGLAEAYSPEDEAFVAGWGENRPSDQLWVEYEYVYRNPQYVYPWFDQPGMATQVVLPMPVKDLLANGSLERIEYR